MEILEQVGLRLREIRLHMGLTQEQVGEAVGLSYSYIGRIERGQKNISLQTLSKIATVLGVSESEFFVYAGQPQLTTPKDIEIKEILTVLNRQDPKTLSKAKNILIETLKQLSDQ